MRSVLTFLLTIFFTTASLATELWTTTVTNGCAEYDSINAYFEPNQYTCASGYFLPADYDGCVVCPMDATCTGGTYTFNTKYAHNVVFNNLITHNVTHGCAVNILPGAAVFEPNTHNCSAGYYLPANVDECTMCPENNYCVGGTYTFNETTAQGITACASGLYAPAGMWESAQCGHILHVGNNVVYLRSVAKTTPSFNFKIGNDIFYANMTTAEVPMNAGTVRQLKASDGVTTWSIYDDTVTISE